MGFIVSDNIELGNSGVVKTNTYVYLVPSSIRLQGQNDDTYLVTGTVHYFYDKASFTANKRALHTEIYTVTMTPAQLNGNLRVRILNFLKQKFINTIDD